MQDHLRDSVARIEHHRLVTMIDKHGHYLASVVAINHSGQHIYAMLYRKPRSRADHADITRPDMPGKAGTYALALASVQREAVNGLKINPGSSIATVCRQRESVGANSVQLNHAAAFFCDSFQSLRA
jgi:hypothetical protein